MKQVFQGVSPGSSNKSRYTEYLVKKVRLKNSLRSITALMTLALVIFPSFGFVMAATSLTVDTDSVTYTFGEYVEISGTANPNVNVTIVVFASNTLETIYEGVIEADEDGEFTIVIPSFVELSEGIYNVTASVDDIVAETYFVGEEALGLKSAIDRAYSFIDKIRTSADRFGDRGYEVYEIDGNITEAEIHLDNALTLLESLDINGSAQEHAEARGILGRTMGLLQSVTRKHAENRATEFITRVQNRIHGLDSAIANLTERVGAVKSDKARGALSAAEVKLQRIRARLAEGEMDDVVGMLNVVADDIDAGLDELNGNGTSTMLKAMNRIQARIFVLNATAKRLARKGENTSRIETELESAEAIMSPMMELLSESKMDEAEGLLEEAKGYLKESGRKLSEMVSPSWIDKRPPDFNTDDDGSSEPQKPSTSSEGTG
jgi:hypothetical protein